MKNFFLRIAPAPALLAALLFVGLGPVVPQAQAATTLLPFNSGWYYFDDGYEPSGWSQPGYDDGDWKYGTGQFGYGDGDEATLVNYGPDDEHKFVTTYFRAYVYIDNPGDYASLTLNLIRDDGALVWLNGTPVLRDNLPNDGVTYGTYALTGLTYPDENSAISATLTPAQFVSGYNLIAVEVHQFEAASPDLSFDLQLIGNAGGGGGGTVTRGPYLQVGTSSNLVVRWRTDNATSTRVRYGTNLASLNLSVSSGALVTDHEITLPNLSPDTKYFYDIGTTTVALAGDATYFFTTAPLPGTPKPTRIWAIGDFGTGFFAQNQVRDAYANFTGARSTDVWLLLGDNAYYSGLDAEYQAYCFNVYPTMFRQAVAWSTMGNHETGTGSQVLTDNYDYYRIFTMPTAGQAGGLASGTEHYYSFDYANIHFVCLDSMTAIYRQPNSAMAQWLTSDLANTVRDWIVVFFHHPPYTKGSHNSDAESDLYQMRQNIVPILEAYGVDLVLSGHSHSYERSYLLDGHYGFSPTISSNNFVNHGNGRTNGTGAYVKPVGGIDGHRGTVYVVDGSSGGQGGGGGLNHPAMFYSVLTPGSLVLDVTGLRLDAKFVSGNGTVDDSFTILKGVPPALQIASAGTNTVVSWPTSLLNYQLEAKPAVETAQWTIASGATTTNAGRKSVTLPTSGSKQIFRLRGLP